jgi:hypothetical protein
MRSSRAHARWIIVPHQVGALEPSAYHVLSRTCSSVFFTYTYDAQLRAEA